MIVSVIDPFEKEGMVSYVDMQKKSVEAYIVFLTDQFYSWGFNTLTKHCFTGVFHMNAMDTRK